MEKTYHIYTSKRYVLLTIKQKLEELGDFKYLDILVIKSQKPSNNIFEMDGRLYKPKTYDELVELLKNIDKVYSFDRVETNIQGATGYDIIVEE